MAKPKNEKFPLIAGNLSLRKNKKSRIQHNQEREDIKYISPKNLQNSKKMITLSWQNITAYLKPKRKFGVKSLSNKQSKCILRDVSGAVEAGGFLAIMGLSGSGKTTLLNVLTNRNLRSLDIMGKVKLNGHIVGDAVIHHCAYIQQDDLLHYFLTVKEHLIFQAMLTIDKNLSYEEKMVRVQNTIDELNLNDCADTRIGIPGSVVGISGGERRRLSLAIELLTDPSIIFCDEPTSGLDSYSAVNVITVLQKLNERGRTVIFTVHQPPSEMYELFDKILLMAIGRVAYMGDKEGAVSFFGNMNLSLPENFSHADSFMYNLAIKPRREQECIDKVNMICNIFEEEQKERQCCTVTDLPEVFRHGATWAMQMKMLLWRSFTQLHRDYKVVLTRVGMPLLIIAMLTAMFYGQQLDQKVIQNINGVLCLLLIQVTMRPFYTAVHRFSRDFPLFVKEHRNGMYRADTYFLCIAISDLAVTFITWILCITFVYHAIGFNSETPAFWICTLTYLLTANAIIFFGYLISCVCSSVSVIAIGAPSISFTFFIFNGFFINEVSIPGFISWVKYFCPTYYAYKILMINQWRNIGNITCEHNASSCIHDGEGVLESMSIEKTELYSNFMGILGLIIFYGMTAFSAFYIMSRRN